VNRVDLFPESGGDGPKVILLHGFTQTLRSWDTIAADLRTDFRVCTVDAPGHGRADQVRVDLPTAALLYAATLGRGTYIGYSMGARLALHIALEQPFVVERLVLLGGSAGLTSDPERATRRAADEALADTIEHDGVGPFLDRWLAQPMFANVPDDRPDRSRNMASGLATSLRLTGTGAQDNLWARLGELTMPVLVLAGEHDAKFTDIGHRMVESIGRNATFAAVPNAGHAAHLEQPSGFLAVLRIWLGRQP
jgi:2-succinyl-6-hydroxy-2,4-cyclohexadiene-1-carboxylate synthase